MRRQIFNRRLIAGMCLVLFQVQLFAASTLGCLHQSLEDLPVNCPFHSSGVEDEASSDAIGAEAFKAVDPALVNGSLLDCPKCALGLGLFHAAGAQTLTAPSAAQRSEAEPLPARHFYRFTPKQFRKPPIATAI
ncbi:MAG: hypothetical protein WBG92_08130 [Thiohalocapsa sp.]